MQSLQQRVEQGGLLSCPAIHPAAQPFFIALLRRLFPKRPILAVTDGVKTQESVHQDVATWLAAGSCFFYPAWETLPHEDKLPHADVISERLETLVALSESRNASETIAPLVVTNVAALMQRTFPPGEIARRTRRLRRGEQLDPLDLIEWLEQAYEPEAKVTQKGELALRGGILDVYPPTSPWPVRLEFFGNELDSLRYFNPATQISREAIESIILPPAGELGILKRLAGTNPAVRGAFLDHLPRETLFVLCEPEKLDEHAELYAHQVTPGDPFYVSWHEIQNRAIAQGMTTIELEELGFPLEVDGRSRREEAPFEDQNSPAECGTLSPSPSIPLPLGEGSHIPTRNAGDSVPQSSLKFQSLESFRPITDHAPTWPSPKRNAASSSPSCTDGCAKTMR